MEKEYNNYTTVTDAIERELADGWNLTMKQAIWLYQNSNGPEWNSVEFLEYDFSAVPAFNEIPDDEEIAVEDVKWAVPPKWEL